MLLAEGGRTFQSGGLACAPSNHRIALAVAFGLVILHEDLDHPVARRLWRRRGSRRCNGNPRQAIARHIHKGGGARDLCLCHAGFKLAFGVEGGEVEGVLDPGQIQRAGIIAGGEHTVLRAQNQRALLHDGELDAGGALIVVIDRLGEYNGLLAGELTQRRGVACAAGARVLIFDAPFEAAATAAIDGAQIDGLQFLTCAGDMYHIGEALAAHTGIHGGGGASRYKSENDLGMGDVVRIAAAAGGELLDRRDGERLSLTHAAAGAVGDDAVAIGPAPHRRPFAHAAIRQGGRGRSVKAGAHLNIILLPAGDLDCAAASTATHGQPGGAAAGHLLELEGRRVKRGATELDFQLALYAERIADQQILDSA